MNKCEEAVFAYLTMMVDVRKSMGKTSTKFKFCGMEDLLLQHGKFFGVGAKSRKIKMGQIKQCFMNAAHLALDNRNFIYCEGFAYNGILPLHHAWVIDSKGNVIDNTWRKTGTAYFGIPFSTDYLRGTLLKTRYYGLLDRWKDGWPLLTGEEDIEKAVCS